MGYYFGKDIKAPIAVPETCKGGYPQPAGQPCPQGFKSKVINGANMCCQEEAAKAPTPATAGVTAVKGAPISTGPTVQPQATEGYGGAILSSLMGAGQAMPPMTTPAAPAVSATTPEISGKALACEDCADCCKKDSAGYLDGKRNTTGTCETNWYPVSYPNVTSEETGRANCCCQTRKSGPDPDLPEGCYLGKQANSATTKCAEIYGAGYSLKDYTAIGRGYWCCKENPAGKSPCIKGHKTTSGYIMTGVGKKTTGPDGCIGQEGTEATHADDGTWWCCNYVAPAGCEGGYLETADGCTGAFVSKTISGKKWCCPKGCDPDDKKSCPSGYKCDPATKKCVFATGVIDRCVTDEDCIKQTGDPNAKCRNGTCGSSITENVCPEGKGMEYAGCKCGKTYVSKAGTCVADYVLEPKTAGTTGWEGWVPGAKGRCDCIKYCTDMGYDVTCTTCIRPEGCEGLGQDPPGEYKWPPELKALYDKMMGKSGEYLDLDKWGGLGEFQYPADFAKLMTDVTGRGQEYLERKPGYSDAVLRAMYGTGFDKAAQSQATSRASLMEQLASEGMLDTGAKTELFGALSGQGEQTLADLQRELFLAGEEQKRKDRADYTGEAEKALSIVGPLLGQKEAASQARLGYGLETAQMGQDLFKTGMDYNSVQEAINAARRGEGTDQLALLLQYLIAMMGSYNVGK